MSPIEILGSRSVRKGPRTILGLHNWMIDNFPEEVERIQARFIARRMFEAGARRGPASELSCAPRNNH